LVSDACLAGSVLAMGFGVVRNYNLFT
jgi:hypothetical protein